MQANMRNGNYAANSMVLYDMQLIFLFLVPSQVFLTASDCAAKCNDFSFVTTEKQVDEETSAAAELFNSLL